MSSTTFIQENQPALFNNNIKTVYHPRRYQADAIKAGVDFFNKKCDNHGLLILPTGSGKSLVIANLASQVEGKTIVFQPSKEILQQNFEKFTSYGYRAGVYSASAGMKYIDKITFATIGSVAKKHHLFRDVKNIIIDECFPYGQYISTEKGKIKIGLFVKRFNEGKNMPRVLSYNQVTKEMELGNVVAAKCNGIKDLINLTFSKNVKIKCTRSHPFLTNNGWKQAFELQVGDCVLSSCNDGTYAAIPNEDQKSLILGSILGDGSIDKTRKLKNINRFRFIQGAHQKAYLEWKANLLLSQVRFVPKNGFAQNGAYAFTSRVMFFEDELCNKKSAIENLTAKSLAVSWMDDGHLFKKDNGGSLYATATSEVLTKELCVKLKYMGIPGNVHEDKSNLSGNTHYYITFGKTAVKNLSRLIAKYVHPSMAYKVCEFYRHQVGTYLWRNNFADRGACVLLSAEPVGGDQVYNIQVKDTETYVITSARYDKNNKGLDSGLIVHNCHLVNAQDGMYHDFIKAIGAKVVGLTATPYRLTNSMEGAMLKFLTRTRPKIFNKVLYYVQNDVLFNSGHLSKLEYFDKNVIDRSLLQTNTTGSDFTEASIKSYYRKIDMPSITIGYANRLLPKRKNLLVFCTMIEEAKRVSAGVPGSVVITGDTNSSERDSLLKKFKAGEIKCVINVGVLTTGFDYPQLEAVLIARSTMSLALYYQIVGRVMRPHKNKESGWVVDLGGNVTLFGKIETMQIIQNDKGLYSIWNNGRQLTNVSFTKT